LEELYLLQWQGIDTSCKHMGFDFSSVLYRCWSNICHALGGRYFAAIIVLYFFTQLFFNFDNFCEVQVLN